MNRPKIGSLFTGSGMLDEGARSVLGGSVAWHAEIDPAASKVLAHRYPDVPNLGDLTAVEWAAVAPVDVLTGGFPCQDVSAAGKRAGLRAGTRSGLWARMCDAIDQLRPALVVAENVRGLLSAEADSALEPCPGCVGDDGDGAVLRALGRVLGDLADLGYDASWYGLRAADVGAPHGRFRVFIVAAHPERATWGAREGKRSGPDEAAGWRTSGVSGGRGVFPAADAHIARSQGRESARRHDMLDGSVAPNAESNARRLSDGDHGVAAHPDRSGIEARSGRPWTGDAGRLQPVVSGGTDWGQYEPAIRRWEQRLSRIAPPPTETGAKGGQRLSPRFVEWMMGWPAGWVTGVPGVSRNDALKICGNGVCPQQAAEALRRLLPNMGVAA